MGIEAEIKQNTFSTEQEKAAINILYTASWIESKNLKRLKPFGITTQQFNVLRILRGSHPKKLMLSDIASRMIDKNSNATRLVEKLRSAQLVTREQCKDNRRQVDINITNKGLDLLAAIDEGTDTWLNNFKNLSTNEFKSLNALLDKLRG
ncbi:MAG: MarR family transcriptional regulator [Bacteroidia bacterium]|nr:MarR family transcriptional regulator [Bacteroidia bacterium]